MSPVSQVVQGAPRVFTLQLGWSKEQEAAADIAATLGALQEQVRGRGSEGVGRELGEVERGTRGRKGEKEGPEGGERRGKGGWRGDEGEER